MALNRVDEGELLMPLYGGMRDDPPWSTFLKRLAARTGGEGVALAFHHAHLAISGHGNIIVRRGGGISTMTAPARPDALHHDALRPGRVYRGEELLAMEDGALFWRAAMQALGARYLRIMRISEPSGLNAWITLLDDRTDFSAADGALLGSLAPHLTVALTNSAAFGEMRLRAIAADEVARRGGFGWAALDAKARLVAASPVAERLLARISSGRRSPGERLLAGHPGTGRALADAAAAFQADPALPSRVIRVKGVPSLHLLVAPFRTRMADMLAPPAMILFVQDGEQGAEPRDRATQIAQLYGLSRSEARLADALLNGRTIAEAAGALNLTVETARNYSKRLYAKTRTHGQADLIRLLAHGLARLA